AAAIESYREFQKSSPGAHGRRGAVARWRILELLRERLLARALEPDGTRELLETLAIEVAEKRRDPYSAVEELLAGDGKEQS
ncbi:MAG: hypothetical protein ACJ74T_00165, partial [Pyrinomonadaceae bacterium]